MLATRPGTSPIVISPMVMPPTAIIFEFAGFTSDDSGAAPDVRVALVVVAGAAEATAAAAAAVAAAVVVVVAVVNDILGRAPTDDDSAVHASVAGFAELDAFAGSAAGREAVGATVGAAAWAEACRRTETQFIAAC